MTSDDVDLERLAEYAAGTLDAAEAAKVADALAAHPSWVSALTQTTAAHERVRRLLADLTVPAIPDDVAASIEAALAEAGRESALATSVGATAAAANSGTRNSTLGRWAGTEKSRRPGPGRAGTTRRTRRTGRFGRFGPILATTVGLGVLALASVATAQLVGHSHGSTSTREAAAPNIAASAAQVPAPQIRHSGVDYTPESVTALAGPTSGSGTQLQPQVPGAGAPGLVRLTDPSALHSCLDAIVRTHGGAARLVDFAQYQHQDAIVVVLSGTGTGTGAGAAASEIVVVGGACGVPGKGTDERFAAAVR